MSPSTLLRQLPGYFAFNSGVMFFIGLASRLTGEGQGAGLAAPQLRVLGFAILLGVLAMAAGFASVARVEFAKRQGAAVSLAWIAPAVLIGLPLGRAAGAARLDNLTYLLPALGMAAALGGMAWLALRARQEIKA